MMILFGGRDALDNALNDTWGLRRHRDGSWDWTKAPSQSQAIPKERYNVRKFVILALNSFSEHFNDSHWRKR